MSNPQQVSESEIFAMERPASSLMTYYTLASFMAGPFFFLPLIPLYFRYHTLRYRFDDEGISMRWGILFRREINLTYARIQDIHLRSNVVERWLNLARIEVQTASGSSGAEMTLEGLHQFEAVRDFLYARMRGSSAAKMARGNLPSAAAAAGDDSELAEILREMTSELRAVRRTLERRPEADRD
ncbi:MAG: PH domain-containing protein [Holophagae bacterium]|jgi:putative membrane protein